MNRQEFRKLRRNKQAYSIYLEAKKMLDGFARLIVEVDDAEIYQSLYNPSNERWIEFAKKNGYKKDYFEMMFAMDFDKAKEFEQTKDFTVAQLVEGIVGRYRRIQNYKQMPYVRPKKEGTAREIALQNNLEKQK